ncbi:LIC_10190 family membrane protein [Butyrivibrio sp. MC2021]|uniref:LIC_10190 family membrane protein n=1 Tax=Butyrivibrio sp. MC2021 TaxID=1408306 RepID=UPI00047A2417|nr:hypothetical protein [Butyrivibrio sp. MC2021]
MVAVLLIWVYVIITTYITGFGFLHFIASWDCMKKQKSKDKTAKAYVNHYKESNIVCGIVLVTVYAQILSLFGGIGLSANLLLIGICACIAVYYRDELLDDLFHSGHIFTVDRNGLYYFLIFLLFAYGTSHGIMHYDSDLYHAQAIHWIEDYGIVKGLGNLHVRLAYNSAAFPLSALYSMSFLGGKSYHVMAGFFALILAWQCLDLKNIARRGHPVLSDFARLAAIYYLFTVFDEIVSPASDYFLSTIVFYVVIHWLDMNVRHEKSVLPYILLSLLGVFAVTVKLSAAPMLLLSVVPIYKLLHNKNDKNSKAVGLSVLLAVIIALPFFLRNIVISGWILYPVTFIDLFNCSWKIPKGLAQYDALEIKTFGRGYNDVAKYGNVALTQWLPEWFGKITGISKLMIILDVVAIALYIAIFVYFLIAFVRNKSSMGEKFGDSKVFVMSHRSMVNIADFLTIGGTMIICLLFWLFSAPLVRYGVVYIWMTAAIVLGRVFLIIYNRLGKSITTWILRGFVAVICVWLFYKGAMLVKEDVARFNPAYLLTQQDYGTYEVTTCEVDGFTFYYPTSGDQTGYEPFPSATHDVSNEITFIGKNIHDGIMSIGE